MWHSSFLPTTTTTTTQQWHRQLPPHSTQCQQQGTMKLTTHECQQPPMNQNNFPQTQMTAHRWKHSHTFHAESRCHVADGDMATKQQMMTLVIVHRSCLVSHIPDSFQPLTDNQMTNDNICCHSLTHHNDGAWDNNTGRRHRDHGTMTQQGCRTPTHTARTQDDDTATHNDTQWWQHGMKTHNNTQQQQHGSKTHNDEHTTTTDHPHVGMRLTTPPSPFPLTPPFPPTSFPFPSTPLFPYPSSLNIPLPFNTPLSFNILPPSLLDIPLPSPSCSLSTSPIPLKYL